ncbi:MAG TPA: hypothetical protein VG733_02685 [Chthoniobacteraceae bacterium]|nr:hypothetical protein [Chthoniobacteraceae bacterium]
MTSEPDIKWNAVAAFVRQLTHDIRNQLNGLELEAALIAEAPESAEAAESLARIREQLHQIAGSLRSLSSKFANPSPMLSPITAVELFLIFQEQAAHVENLPKVDWTHTLQQEQINVDATELAIVARELLTNARDFQPGERVEVRGLADGGSVIFQFHEPKAVSIETATLAGWGSAPFESARRNRYGLGLWEARRLVEANNGKITRAYEAQAKKLLTTLTFPIL